MEVDKMTWRELRAKINMMTDDELDEEVCIITGFGDVNEHYTVKDIQKANDDLCEYHDGICGGIEYKKFLRKSIKTETILKKGKNFLLLK